MQPFVDIGALRAAACTKVEAEREVWEAEKTKLIADLAAHTKLGDNYWKAEHHARARYHAALALLDAIS